MARKNFKIFKIKINIPWADQHHKNLCWLKRKLKHWNSMYNRMWGCESNQKDDYLKLNELGCYCTKIWKLKLVNCLGIKFKLSFERNFSFVWKQPARFWSVQKSIFHLSLHVFSTFHSKKMGKCFTFLSYLSAASMFWTELGEHVCQVGRI